jgi:hypothetical protein
VRLAPLASLLLIASVLLAGCQLPVPGGGGRVGSAAKALLDPREHEKLLVEIDFPAGAAPNAEAKDILLDTLVQISGRDRSRIDLVENGEIPGDANKKYSLAELRALEAEHRDHTTGGDTAAIYILYVAGGYEGDDGDARVLGVAHGGTSVAIFKGNVRAGARSGPLGLPTVPEACIERAVLVHEFGHALGLVNLGTPMVRDHEDKAHEGHSSNKGSVMYYAVENTVDLLSFFTGGCEEIPYKFDGDDLADLKALRDS